MDFAALFHTIADLSIVGWFAVLVVVFTVSIGLGIYQCRRVEADQQRRARTLSRRRPTRRKEYT